MTDCVNPAPCRDLATGVVAYHGRLPAALVTRSSRATRVDRATDGGALQRRMLVMDHAGHFWPNPTRPTEAWIVDRGDFAIRTSMRRT